MSERISYTTGDNSMLYRYTLNLQTMSSDVYHKFELRILEAAGPTLDTSAPWCVARVRKKTSNLPHVK